MNTENRQIKVSGLTIYVVRKAIKNLHLGVYPPNGRVRVAAPLAVSNDAIRLAVIGKLSWIKRQRARFEAQPRQSERELIRRESHYFLGKRYLLRVCERNGAAKIAIPHSTTMELVLRPGSTTEQRERILRRWYREQLKALIPPLLQKWEPILGVCLAEWGIKRMKTKWGTCNPEARRIWLNLELAKKPAQCLEYIVVHELVHLLERHHNDRFIGIMDKVMPQWRLHRSELNSAPLAHDTWNY